MTATVDRGTARELTSDVVRRLRDKPQRTLRLDDADAAAARELPGVLFGARVEPVQVVHAGTLGTLVFEDDAGHRRVRLARDDVPVAEVVDLGDRLQSARASIARLRAIAV